jgi:hypothetical protein
LACAWVFCMWSCNGKSRYLWILQWVNFQVMIKFVLIAQKVYSNLCQWRSRLLYYFLLLENANRKKVLDVCRLNQIPNLRTFDRKFKVLPISQIIKTCEIYLCEKSWLTASTIIGYLNDQGNR